MHWSIYIILAGMINACTNYVYKLNAGRDNNVFLLGAVYGLSAVLLIAYHFIFSSVVPAGLFTPVSLLTVVVMGIGSATCFTLMFMAFAKAGPLSLVDPLWVCLYTLVSLLAGLFVTHEHPSTAAIIGMLCFVGGAFLIAKGKA